MTRPRRMSDAGCGWLLFADALAALTAAGLIVAGIVHLAGY